MRRVLFLAAGLLTAAGAGGSEPIVVLSKGIVAQQGVAVGSEAAAFIRLAQSANEWASPLPLMAPPEWGRTVAGAAGAVRLQAAVPNGLILRVKLTGLVPKHRYILTLNGNPKLPGNDRLPDPVPGLPEERYLDFFTATTDERGGYEATFGIALPAGPYEVRFYVKDTADFKIVLYHDYFPCAVKS